MLQHHLQIPFDDFGWLKIIICDVAQLGRAEERRVLVSVVRIHSSQLMKLGGAHKATKCIFSETSLSTTS